VHALRRLLAPDSAVLLAVLVTAAVALTVLAARRGRLWPRVAAAGVALSLVFSAGAIGVNVHFGYFTSWADVTTGAVHAGLAPGATRGSSAAAAHRTGARRAAPIPPDTGPRAVVLPAVRGGGQLSRGQVDALLRRRPARAGGDLLSVTLTGRRSRITRRGLVWLPPQYRAAAFSRTRFPVVELIPGTPGQPRDWVHFLHITNLLAALTARGTIAPMVVVMAPSNPPHGRGQECTDQGTRGAQDSTYVGVDVPADITAGFRVFAPGPHWAVAGYSTGGYCAVDLTLKHPGTYGAVADLDGYLSPREDGHLWHVIFNRDEAAIAAYTIPIELARDHCRLPPFYLAAGTGNLEDLNDLRTLRRLLTGRAAVTTHVTPGGHRFPVWAAELPAVLTWISSHIAAGPRARTPGRPSTTSR